jgi:hypothetical protein
MRTWNDFELKRKWTYLSSANQKSKQAEESICPQVFCIMPLVWLTISIGAHNIIAEKLLFMPILPTGQFDVQNVKAGR